MSDSEIVRVIANKLSPLLLLFGLYLSTYGQLSPGGGFQGGVIIGSAMALLMVGHGLVFVKRRFSIKLMHVGGALALLFLLLLGMVGIVEGEGFLANVFPVGQQSGLSCALMILAMNLAIGVNVGVGMLLILFFLARYRI